MSSASTTGPLPRAATTPRSPAPPVRDAPLDAQGRRRLRGAVVGGAFGFFVDMYDVYLPTIALAPAIAYFVPTSLSRGSAAIVTAFIFVATLFGRPVGAFVFGPFADRVGRKKVTLFSVAGCGVTTLLIAVLPGYRTAGVWAIVALVLLRFVDGIFIGGEYTGAMALAMEASPRGRRGLFGSLVGCGFPLSYCSIALVTYGTLHVFRSGGPTSSYSEWGWRVPFLVGAVLSGLFLVYYRRAAHDAPVVKGKLATQAVRNPSARLLTTVKRNYWSLFVVMTGVWFASNMASSLLASTAKAGSDLSATRISLVIVVAQAIHTVLFPVLGALSDRVGRKPVVIGCGVTTATACAWAFHVFAGRGIHGFGAVLALVVLIRVSGASVFALTPSYLCERFPTFLRGTGYGLSYSLPLVVTGFYAYYQDWLSSFMARAETPVVLLVLAGVLMVVGMLLSPETRHYALEDHPLEAEYQGAPRAAEPQTAHA